MALCSRSKPCVALHWAIFFIRPITALISCQWDEGCNSLATTWTPPDWHTAFCAFSTSACPDVICLKAQTYINSNN